MTPAWFPDAARRPARTRPAQAADQGPASSGGRASITPWHQPLGTTETYNANPPPWGQAGHWPGPPTDCLQVVTPSHFSEYLAPCVHTTQLPAMPVVRQVPHPAITPKPLLTMTTPNHHSAIAKRLLTMCTPGGRYRASAPKPLLLSHCMPAIAPNPKLQPQCWQKHRPPTPLECSHLAIGPDTPAPRSHCSRHPPRVHGHCASLGQQGRWHCLPGCPVLRRPAPTLPHGNSPPRPVRLAWRAAQSVRSRRV